MHETASSHPCAPVPQVHAIFEPKQDSTAKDLVLVDDEDAEVRLGKLASMLGLTRVGLIIGHPAREYRGMSTGRTLLRPWTAGPLHAPMASLPDTFLAMSLQHSYAFSVNELLLASRMHAQAVQVRRHSQHQPQPRHGH